LTSPYLTAREALDYLRVTTLSQLYRLMRERGLPHLRCGGRLRFDMRELDAWLRGTDHVTLVRERRKQAR
jgi:excisionase family DNA binding protein